MAPARHRAAGSSASSVRIMRAEVLHDVDAIKQSLGLLRRHL
jgi:hypothetical protein